MTPYSAEVESAMKAFFGSLREKDRRRYAAVEAAKLGPGGVEYMARLLRIAPKAIRQGQADLKDLPDVPPERCRKKGAAEALPKGGQSPFVHDAAQLGDHLWIKTLWIFRHEKKPHERQQPAVDLLHPGGKPAPEQECLCRDCWSTRGAKARTWQNAGCA